MTFERIGSERFEELADLHVAYKAEIGEERPTAVELESLLCAIRQGRILFYGCICNDRLVACCSVCITYSTYCYGKSGVFEDFYILPAYRHKGIARQLVEYVWDNSGVGSLTVGCADCDAALYQAIGFRIHLGNMLAYGA